MTDKLREAAEAALVLLDEIHPGNMTSMAENAWSAAINELRAALAERWVSPIDLTASEIELLDGMIEVQRRHSDASARVLSKALAKQQRKWNEARIALLTRIKDAGIQPRREWRSLTDEEIFALRDAHAVHLSWGVRDFACAIEAALKEKNT